MDHSEPFQTGLREINLVWHLSNYSVNINRSTLFVCKTKLSWRPTKTAILTVTLRSVFAPFTLEFIKNIAVLFCCCGAAGCCYNVVYYMANCVSGKLYVTVKISNKSLIQKTNKKHTKGWKEHCFLPKTKHAKKFSESIFSSSKQTNNHTLTKDNKRKVSTYKSGISQCWSVLKDKNRFQQESSQNTGRNLLVSNQIHQDMMRHLWWSLWTLCLLACQVRVTADDSSVCWCVHVTPCEY